MSNSQSAPWITAQVSRIVVKLGIRVAFAHVGTAGTMAIRDLDRPVLLVANHTSGADSWLAMEVTRRYLGGEFGLVAAARVVQKFAFLESLGLFPVEEESPLASARSLRAIAAGVSDRPRSRLWIFPEGRHCPSCVTPGEFSPGAYILARSLPAALIVPVGFCYYVFRQPRAAVSIYFGAPLLEANELARLSWSEAKNVLETGVRDALESAKRKAVLEDSRQIRYPFINGSSR